jgi:hypothetical protein
VRLKFEALAEVKAEVVLLDRHEPGSSNRAV